MRQLSIVVAGAVLLVASPAAAFDVSDYRQNTYGPPNHFCDPTRPLTSPGAGTAADPWTMTQCASEPVAGDVVGILPGVSVRLPTTNDDNVPAFRPTHEGTPTSRIVYVTKHAAVALANVETSPNRTELRHDGGAPGISGGIGTGTGCAMYGSNGRSYVTFDGFYVDMAQAFMKEDSGIIRSESATGVHFKNFVIKGTTLTVASNPVIYRPQNAIDTLLSNFRAYDFHNDPTGSATPQAALFSDQYGDRNFVIEHFDIRNTQRGIFLKGTAPAGVNFNYGTIRYGIVHDVEACFRFNDLDPTHLTTLEYSLCYDYTRGGVMLTNETTNARNLLIHHVTVARGGATDINQHGGMYMRFGMGANVTLRDNLLDVDSGNFGHAIDAGELASAMPALDYNGYFKNGSTVTWAHNGSEYNAIASWRAAVGRDAHSRVLTSSPFADRTNTDFHVPVGHEAKTASSTGAELGAYAGVQTVGVDVVLSPPDPPDGGGPQQADAGPGPSGSVPPGEVDGGTSGPSSNGATSDSDASDSGGCRAAPSSPSANSALLVLVGAILVRVRARRRR